MTPLQWHAAASRRFDCAAAEFAAAQEDVGAAGRALSLGSALEALGPATTPLPAGWLARWYPPEGGRAGRYLIWTGDEYVTVRVRWVRHTAHAILYSRQAPVVGPPDLSLWTITQVPRAVATVLEAGS